ncbi:MFS transporter [Nesterenkonia muleiensis]|uniref:MFS transporter n=1 Tax=Nesterenkonia muleiensis TaxID=2282648 RepID=UPI0013002625|nr:MFS transporter [Nesterenkonia muleiensis]
MTAGGTSFRSDGRDRCARLRAQRGVPVGGTSTVPGVYWLWLAGLAWTSIGANLLSFGMVWTATEYSATLAGIVLLAVTVPRVTLGLFGGAVADRIGPIRVMLASDVVMVSFTAAAAVAAYFFGPHPMLLIGAALVLGTADAFYLPAAGSVPKFLVPGAGLPRAMAARQMVFYFASVIGPGLGGVAVTAAGLPLSFALGAVGFTGMLLILLGVRRRIPTRTTEDDACRSQMLAQIRDGVGVILTEPLLRAVLVMTSGFALFVLPLTSIMVPVLARDRGWHAALAGTAAGAFSAGMAVLAVWVMWRSGAHRAGAAAILGMVLTGGGILGLAFAPSELLAIAAVLSAGLGAGLFSTHIGPLLVAATPPEYTARVQAVMMIAQAAPMMLAGPVIGVMADVVPVGVVVILWGVGAVTVALGALVSRPLRAARRPG